MSPFLVYLTVLGALLAIALGVLVFVHRPLLAILEEVCGGGHRARFWVNLFHASTVLAVLFWGTVAAPSTQKATDYGALEYTAVVRSGIFGLLLTLGLLALVMLFGITGFERRQAWARRTAAEHPGDAG